MPLSIGGRGLKTAGLTKLGSYGSSPREKQKEDPCDHCLAWYICIEHHHKDMKKAQKEGKCDSNLYRRK